MAESFKRFPQLLLQTFPAPLSVYSHWYATYMNAFICLVNSFRALPHIHSCTHVLVQYFFFRLFINTRFAFICTNILQPTTEKKGKQKTRTNFSLLSATPGTHSLCHVCCVSGYERICPRGMICFLAGQYLQLLLHGRQKANLTRNVEIKRNCLHKQNAIEQKKCLQYKRRRSTFCYGKISFEYRFL